MKDYKKRLNFELGTTSYILHDKENNLIKNVDYLSKYFDKIQLLFFGKNYLQEVMSDYILSELIRIKKETGIKYCIHLPTDLSLLDESVINEGIQVIDNIINKTNNIGIEEYIIHVDKYLNNTYPEIELTEKNKLLFKNILEKIHNISKRTNTEILIENLSYDLMYFYDIIKSYNYKICLDIGHLIGYGHELDNYLSISARISMLHIHGISDKKDHNSLSYIKDTKYEKNIISLINNFRGTVIIEVFNREDLEDSLSYLENILV